MLCPKWLCSCRLITVAYECSNSVIRHIAISIRGQEYLCTNICQIAKYVTLFSSKSLMHNFFWKNETFIFVNELQVAITITNIRVKVKKESEKVVQISHNDCSASEQ